MENTHVIKKRGRKPKDKLIDNNENNVSKILKQIYMRILFYIFLI